MTKIHSIKVKNFRGIKDFSHNFNENSMTCIIGRGDSGKTTILEGISLLFSNSWNVQICDTDFFNSDINSPIEIEAVIYDIPGELLKENKFGLYVIGIDKNTKEIKEYLDNDSIPGLDILLKIDKNLEPLWTVKARELDNKSISHKDREKLNVFLISDNINKHFTWNTGSPLYYLNRIINGNDSIDNGLLQEVSRNVKKLVDENSFENFVLTLEKIRISATSLGLKLSNIKPSINLKDILFSGTKLSLHEDNLPLIEKGKGTKRLLSIAIQMANVNERGVLLIDEIEQGLEPDRIQHIVQYLKTFNNLQTIFTTHSNLVVTEVTVTELLMIKNDGGIVSEQPLSDEYQDLIRSCPEIGYSNRIIVCEGKTEVGICRSINRQRIKKNAKSFSYYNCICVYGSGKDNAAQKAQKMKQLGLDVAFFCDSDKPTNPTKEELRGSGVNVIDCEQGNDIEHQFMQDVPWDAIKELIQYTMIERKMTRDQIWSSIKSKYDGGSSDEIKDTPKWRKAIADTAIVKDKEWVKRIDHGEVLGNIILENMSIISEKHLGKMIFKINEWVENNDLSRR